jgi:hypothetical protein
MIYTSRRHNIVGNALARGPLVRSALERNVTLQWIARSIDLGQRSIESLTTSWTSRSSSSTITKGLWKCENASSSKTWGQRNSGSHKKMYDPSSNHKIAPTKLLPIKGT